MRQIHFYSLFVLISLCACSGTTYWTAENEYPRSRIRPCEIHITDSTYTIISYYARRNRGDIQVFKSEFKGDTLLVYDLFDQSWAESDTANHQFSVIDAYLQKGRKLYPLYWSFPPIYPKKDFKYYYEGDGLGAKDDSGIHGFPIDWQGAPNDTAFINLKGYYQARVKYKKLRETIEFKNTTDSTLWEIKLPNQKISDTVAVYSEWFIKYGPLKTKKGKLVDLR